MKMTFILANFYVSYHSKWPTSETKNYFQFFGSSQPPIVESPLVLQQVVSNANDNSNSLIKDVLSHLQNPLYYSHSPIHPVLAGNVISSKHVH